MPSTLDRKRIRIFVAFAYGIALATALVIYLTGAMKDSPVLIPGSNVTLAVALTATIYMSAPALANVLTRTITREGWKDTWLRPRLRQGWPFWLAAWVLPSVLTLAGAAIYFLIFPQQFSTARVDLLSGSGYSNPWGIVASQLLLAVVISPFVNGLFTFGEEFGWRAYLLQKLMPLGGRKAVLILGVIWGAWHWPLTVMGHNYGLNYPGFPWLGMLVMVWFTTALSVFLGWVTLRAGSVWPAVIGHAAVNGFGAAALVFASAQPNMLLGPAVAGVIGCLGFTLFAVALLLAPGALEPRAAPVSALEPLEEIPAQ